MSDIPVDPPVDAEKPVDPPKPPVEPKKVRPGVAHAEREFDMMNLAFDFQAKLMAVVDMFDNLFGDESIIERNGVADMLHTMFVRKNITPLTDNPAEWEQVTQTLWRNVRDDEAFSTNGGLVYWYSGERRINNTFPLHMSEHFDASTTNEEPTQ